MRLGPKALVGLGLPAALRPHAPNKGVGAWILATRFWRDLGRWDDNAVWRD